MKCDICIKPAKPHSISCDRCYKRVNVTKFYRLARRTGLRTHYDRSIDRFRCHLTNVAMVDDDPFSPYYVVCSQQIPGNHDVLLPNCAFTAVMKSDLSDTELLAVVPHLDDHLRTGKPFIKDIIPFKYWRRKARPAIPDKFFAGTPTAASSKSCAICIRAPFRNSPYCPRCRKIIQPKDNRQAVVATLKEHYDPEADGFRCAYTGILLEDGDIFSPWYIVMDHLVPGQEKLVPAAFWVNDMKGCMTHAGFKKALAEFANHILTGEPFDTGVITKEDWKRALRYMRRDEIKSIE